MRLLTLGGLESVEGQLISQAPSTGLIVAADGYILASASSFVQEPDGVLVVLPDGSQTAATIVARDRARMLVLLRVETSEKLPVPEFVPRSEIAVGQRAIAVGRGLDAKHPNLSVGIVSATQRVWGRAIQTDAKISSLNYGGPLIDLRGRVLGILAPMSPDDDSQLAGTELYDSGIGFAVPVVDLLGDQLDRMRRGEDLQPGLLGVSLKGTNPYTAPAVISLCPPRTPAREAGLRVGDEIVALDEVPISRHVHLRHALGSRMAGDTVSLKVRRGSTTLEFDVQLVNRIEPYDLPFLGILPTRLEGAEQSSQRDAPDDDAARRTRKHAPLTVRFVYPDSPAAKAGLQPDDQLVALNGHEPADLAAWREALSQPEPGGVVELTWLRDRENKSIKIPLGRHPDALPAELMPVPPNEELPKKIERTELRLPNEPNACPGLLPGPPDPGKSWGLIVWLAPPGKLDHNALEATWGTACMRRGIMLIAPRPRDDSRWESAELDTIRQFVAMALRRFPIDPLRTASGGYQMGGTLAYAFAFQQRELIHGVVVADAGLPHHLRPRGNDPQELLQFLVLQHPAADHAASLAKDVDLLRKMRFPVVVL
ncbi:MAG TPA: PDZ domain-containing protein, partial [Pirellulaceae bacterium]